MRFNAECPVHEFHRVVTVARAFDDAYRTQAIAHAFAGEDASDRRAAFFFVHVVVQETDIHGNFAGCEAFGRKSAFDVFGDVRAQGFEVGKGLVFTPQGDEGGEDYEIGRASCRERV